jgi:uncharacterized protein YndB with AHSA1/START domain
LRHTTRSAPRSPPLAYVQGALPPDPERNRTAESAGIRAEGVVPAPREDVFAFLEDLENHWLITDRFVRVLSLDGPVGARTGGRVRIRAPLGLGRTAVIRAERVRRPEELIGSARVGEATRAQVRWTLHERGDETTVCLTAQLTAAGLADRILWAAGGRIWMRRRLERTLRGLSHRLA